MPQSTFDVYADPGHAWGKVPKNLLEQLGIADKISRCSYQKSESAYLEEDCDLTLFREAYKNKFGTEPKWKEHHTDKNSKIRNYQPYAR